MLKQEKDPYMLKQEKDSYILKQEKDPYILEQEKDSYISITYALNILSSPFPIFDSTKIISGLVRTGLRKVNSK